MAHKCATKQMFKHPVISHLALPAGPWHLTHTRVITIESSFCIIVQYRSTIFHISFPYRNTQTFSACVYPMLYG